MSALWSKTKDRPRRMPSRRGRIGRAFTSQLHLLSPTGNEASESHLQSSPGLAFQATSCLCQQQCWYQSSLDDTVLNSLQGSGVIEVWPKL
jgi:hypothetical protein